MEQDQRIYALVAAAKQGDSNAFTELYNSSYGMVYHTCYGYLKNREDAEDTTQEVFIYIYNKLADLEDNYAYYGWLKTIAVHTSINKIRARKDNASYDDAVGNEEILEGDDNLEMLPDTYVLRDEKRKIVMGIMEKELSEVQYQTLFMYYYNDFKIEQIAQIMEVSEGTVKTRLKSAKIKVKQGIEAYEQKTGDRLAINGAIPSIAMLLKASTNAVPVSVLPFAGFGIMGATGGAVAGGIAKAAAGVKVPAKVPVQAPSQMYGAQPHVPNSNPARQAAKKTASSAAKGATKGAGKGAGKGIATKVVAGIASVAILGAGTVGVMKLVDNKKDEPSKPAHKKESVETTYLEPVETDSALLEADPFNGQKFEVGGKVTFGNYEGEDISWLVLDEKDGNYLVLSEYGLEDGAFDERSIQLGDEQLYWEIFSCRTWLNGDFYNAAFDTDIQDRIILTTVTADPNPNYSSYQGNDTQDKVFLLSVNEVQQYLGDNVNCYVTQRVANNNNYYVSNCDGKCSWWLRTMGEDPTCATLCNSIVDSNIVVELCDMRGRSAYSRDGNDLMIHCCFRPAMWVRPGTGAASPAEPTPEAVVPVELNIEPGDVITLGNYKGVDLTWRVLEEKDGNYLVITEWLIDHPGVNVAWDMTWGTSEVRTWLGGEFMNGTFDADTISRIQETTLVTQNEDYQQDPVREETTVDKIFILDIAELYAHFDGKKSKECYQYYDGRENDRDYYTIRGNYLEVYPSGDVDVAYYYDDNVSCVRPAMWINLEGMDVNVTHGVYPAR